jgi:hypothetical protein
MILLPTLRQLSANFEPTTANFRQFLHFSVGFSVGAPTAANRIANHITYCFSVIKVAKLAVGSKFQKQALSEKSNILG